MKTKIFLFLLGTWALAQYCTAQQNKYFRSMEATIVAADQFESSRLNLMEQCSEPNFLILTYSEIKDGSTPAKFDIEFRTDESGYSTIDKLLDKLGHVSYKNATLFNSSLTGDTTIMRQTLDENTRLIATLTEKIANDTNFKDTLQKIDDLKNENKKIALALGRAKLTAMLPDKITIHLTQ